MLWFLLGFDISYLAGLHALSKSVLTRAKESIENLSTYMQNIALFQNSPLYQMKNNKVHSMNYCVLKHCYVLL